MILPDPLAPPGTPPTEPPCDEDDDDCQPPPPPPPPPPTDVPEPAGLLILLVGLAAVFGLARRARA